MYTIVEKTLNYVKLEHSLTKMYIHLVRRTNKDYSVTNWFCQMESPNDPDPMADDLIMVAILPDYKIKERWGVDPNTYYAIYDTAKGKYLQTGYNTLREEDAYEVFLHFWCTETKFWDKKVNAVYAPKFFKKYESITDKYLEERADEAMFQEWVDEIKYSDMFMVDLLRRSEHVLHSSPNKYKKDYAIKSKK